MGRKESAKCTLKRTQDELASAQGTIEHEKARGAQYKRRYGEAVLELEKTNKTIKGFKKSLRAALCKMGDLKLELNKVQLLVKKMSELCRAAKDLVAVIERIGIENGGAVNVDDIEDSLLEVRCCLSEIDKYRAELQQPAH